MAELKHNVADHTCGNCAYWKGQRLVDNNSGVSFINPNEIAKCDNPSSPDNNHNVSPAHSCNFWKEAM